MYNVYRIIHKYNIYIYIYVMYLMLSVRQCEICQPAKCLLLAPFSCQVGCSMTPWHRCCMHILGATWSLEWWRCLCIGLYWLHMINALGHGECVHSIFHSIDCRSHFFDRETLGDHSNPTSFWAVKCVGMLRVFDVCDSLVVKVSRFAISAIFKIHRSVSSMFFCPDW